MHGRDGLGSERGMRRRADLVFFRVKPTLFELTGGWQAATGSKVERAWTSSSLGGYVRPRLAALVRISS